MQYSTVQYSTVQYSTVQYSTVQYSTVQYSSIQYSTVQYSTVQYSTVQYSTVQFSSVQVSSMQFSTVPFNLNVKFHSIQAYFSKQIKFLLFCLKLSCWRTSKLCCFDHNKQQRMPQTDAMPQANAFFTNPTISVIRKK